MASVHHSCCVRFLALCLTANLQLITQFMPLGSLLEFVKHRYEIIDAEHFIQWSSQMAEGMCYLASRGIIHRDLAARNVLLESINQVLITDFGLAKCLDSIGCEYRASGGRMPIKWLAIESIQGRIFSTKSDVWAYGVTLWEMFTFGHRPYENVRAKDLMNYLEKGHRLPIPETTSLQYYSIMLQCWNKEPMDRPSFDELYHIMEQMKSQPNQYLFYTSKLQLHSSTDYLQSSKSAFEFLSQYFSHQNSLNLDKNDINTNLSDSCLDTMQQTSWSTDYAQIQNHWFANLYFNHKAKLFPKNIQTILNPYYEKSNYYSYLLDDCPINDYYPNLYYSQSESGYIEQPIRLQLGNSDEANGQIKNQIDICWEIKPIEIREKNTNNGINEILQDEEQCVNTKLVYEIEQKIQYDCQPLNPKIVSVINENDYLEPFSHECDHRMEKYLNRPSSSKSNYTITNSSNICSNYVPICQMSTASVEAPFSTCPLELGQNAPLLTMSSNIEENKTTNTDTIN